MVYSTSDVLLDPLFALKSLQGAEGAGDDWRSRRGVSLGWSLTEVALTGIDR